MVGYLAIDTVLCDTSGGEGELSGLVLNYGGYEYCDRTGSFMDGPVRPSGIDLNHIVVTPYNSFAEEGFTVSTIGEAA